MLKMIVVYLCFPILQASLTYAEAQMRIDDTTQTDDVTKNLRGLNKLAKILKKHRILKGWGLEVGRIIA